MNHHEMSMACLVRQDFCKVTECLQGSILTTLIRYRYLDSHTGLSRGDDQVDVLTSSDESFGSAHIQ